MCTSAHVLKRHISANGNNRMKALMIKMAVNLCQACSVGVHGHWANFMRNVSGESKVHLQIWMIAPVLLPRHILRDASLGPPVYASLD